MEIVAWWTYGVRPDGRTVGVKTENRPATIIWLIADWRNLSDNGSRFEMPSPRIHFRRRPVITIITLALTSSSIHDCVGSDDGEIGHDDFAWLPKTSADFFASSSCADDVTFFDQDDESFMRWVLSARHVTWNPGWEVVPNANATRDESAGGDVNNDEEGPSKTTVGYYARVFDLLNWSMLENLLPTPVSTSKVCHKGMELDLQDDKTNNDFTNIPLKPNTHIPTERWTSLWNTCRKQLLSKSRVSSIVTQQSSSSCIDIPGIIIENPSPPLKVNNPCHLEYRMVDGAHRMCLRKYVLSLLWGELIESKERLKDAESDIDTTKETNSDTSSENFSPTVLEIKSQISYTQQLIQQTSIGFFLVLNQTNFQSFLTNSDPHTSWAQSKSTLMHGFTQDLKLKWAQWMDRVMNRVLVWKIQFIQDESEGDTSKGDKNVLKTCIANDEL